MLVTLFALGLECDSAQSPRALLRLVLARSFVPTVESRPAVPSVSIDHPAVQATLAQACTAPFSPLVGEEKFLERSVLSASRTTTCSFLLKCQLLLRM